MALIGATGRYKNSTDLNSTHLGRKAPQSKWKFKWFFFLKKINKKLFFMVFHVP
jgi:hypothetical protein